MEMGLVFPSTTTSAIALVCLALLTPIGVGIYNLYFHPLAKFPGPKLYCAYYFPFGYQVTKGEMFNVVRDMHAKYGDIVRYAPNALSFTTPTCWNDIYSHKTFKNFARDPVTSKFVRNQIFTTDDNDHARYRKLLAHAFSEKAVREQQDIVNLYVDNLITALKDRALGGSKMENSGQVDLVQWYNFTTFDIIGDLAFGSSFGCLDSSSLHPWVHLIFDSIKSNTISVALLQYKAIMGALMWLSEKLGRGSKQNEHHQLVHEKVGQRLEMKTERPDFTSYILRHNDKDEITRAELESNASTLIKAGSETTATALSGATYWLLRNPDKLALLKEEIRTAFSSVDQMDPVTLANCKYLDACLRESLRAYPATPTGLLRYATVDSMVSGHMVPKGTYVSIWQKIINHSENYFYKPYEYAPERWLSSEDPASPYRHDNLEVVQPFSVGPRNCIGKNLAWLEMRLILARVLFDFDLELPEGTAADWDPEKQKIYILWEKPALNVRLIPRAN